MRFRALGLFGLLAVAARAQEAQLRLYEDFRPPTALTLAPSVVATNTAVAEGGPSEDLGKQILLLRRGTPRLFQVSSDTEYLYDSNILLLDKHKIDDDLLSETVKASFTPRLIDRLESSVYAKYQIVRYSDHSNLDFEANAVGLSLSRPVGNVVTVYGNFEAARLYLTDGNDEFFKMFDTTLGIWRGHNLGDWAWLFYGYQVDWRPSSPSAFTRVDNAGYIGVKVMPVDRLTLQVYYRLRDEAYYQESRNDLNHLISLSATYDFNNYISARVFAEYRNNNSDSSGFDYTACTGGVGLKLALKF